MARGPAPGSNGLQARTDAFPGWDAGLVAALERLTIAVRRPARGVDAGAVRSPARGRALEFADYRAYTPGDDPRLVDWRTYARLDRLFLKQYEEERSRAVTLLVDVSGSLDWGEGDEHKGYFVRRLAAALAWIALARHDRLRVFLLREGGATLAPPAFGRAGAVALWRRLENQREGGRTGLASAVEAALVAAAPGPTILLSDLLDDSWPGALAALAATGEAAVLHVLAPAEWEPPLDEEIELEDAETGELRATRWGPAELAAYRSRLAAWLAELEGECRRRDLRYVGLTSGTPLAEVLLRRLTAAGVLVG